MSQLYSKFGFIVGCFFIGAFLINFSERAYGLLVGGAVMVILNFVTNTLLHIYIESLKQNEQLAELSVLLKKQQAVQAAGVLERLHESVVSAPKKKTAKKSVV